MSSSTSLEPRDEAGPVRAPAGECLTPPELSVETVSDFQQFLELETVWNDLVDEAGVEHPFLRHEWVRTWWECFGATKELRVLVVKSGGAAVAIAPLMLSAGRMYGVRVRRLEFIWNVHTPRFDFIVARRAEEAYRAIWGHLREKASQWDVLMLPQLAAGSRMLVELPRLAEAVRFRVGLWRSADSPYVPLVGSWECYLKSLDGKHRANLRNRLKRLARLGPVGLEVISSGREMEATLAEGMEIEAAAWKSDAGTAMRSRPEVHRFYTLLAERAAAKDWLRLQFLTVNGQRIAFGYFLYYGNRLYLLKPGYDVEYAPYSPFNLLCYLALRAAFERGLVEYDFLGVNERWKLEWTKETRPHYWVFVFSDRLSPRLLYWTKFCLVPRLQRYLGYVTMRGAVVALRRRLRPTDED